MPLGRLPLCLLPALAAGCLGGPLGEADRAALDGETAAPPPEWVRCWIVPDAGEDPSWPAGDHLFCQWTKPSEGAAFPIAHVFVQAVAGSRIVETQMLERWPGQPVEIMALAPADYPVRLGLQLLVGGARPVGLESLGELRATTTLASAAAAPVDAPWLVVEPFETWDVTIDVQTLLFEGFLHRVDVPLAPLTSPIYGPVAQAAGRFPLGRQGDLLTLRFAVPPGTTSIPADARLGRDETRVAFVVAGPGAYVATPAGVTRAPEPPPAPAPEPPPPTPEDPAPAP